MKRYQILSVAIRERTQIEEELNKEDSFEISDTEEQLLSEQAVILQFSLDNSSHRSLEQQSNQTLINQEFLDTDQYQRDELYTKIHQNQLYTNKRAAQQYSKQHTIRTFSKGDHVSIAVPAQDKGSTDPK